ncbi:DUF1254 domain-containing protein [Methylocapsa palsarum]|uniref:Uncharacterized conserved protein n=1 Tax=Methylocapsa palsarum TaxID=1612308 RepID=A0A1I3XX53_9HYPH|nr:DUF1254 domain-containing protein [Methylocapsa palsarum]SFK24073.1 Uncharacterized conserved protein [Methylocapsa palsarum]
MIVAQQMLARVRAAQARKAGADSFRIGLLTAVILCCSTCAYAQIAPPPPELEYELEKKAAFSQTEAARTKALEAYSDALGLTAATWGAPLVTMYSLRYNDAVGPNARALANTIWRMDDISTPELSREAGYVTPNVNTLYGFGFLDLSAEPVILQVPDSHGRYYMVEIVDFWTNAFAYAGGVATGYKGGRFALVGPRWKGKLPANVKRIDCPTRWVLVQPRVHVRDRADLPAAKEVLDAITVQGLSAATGKPAPLQPVYHYAAPEFADSKLPVSALSFRDPVQFWEILAAALIENPPPQDQMKALLPLFRPLGLTPGQPFDRAKVEPVVLESMRKVAAFTGKALSLLPNGSFRNGWVTPAPTIGDFGVDYYNRAVTARNGLTANTPREAIYIGGVEGNDGERLSGDKRYTVTFKVLPPTVEPGFWSLTLYGLADNYTVPNPIHRYSLGSDDTAMRLNADGSLTIAIQKDSPGEDKETNWLPAPEGAFYLVLRAYAPGAALLRSQTEPDAYPLPPIVVEKSP